MKEITSFFGCEARIYNKEYRDFCDRKSLILEMITDIVANSPDSQVISSSNEDDYGYFQKGDLELILKTYPDSLTKVIVMYKKEMVVSAEKELFLFDGEEFDDLEPRIDISKYLPGDWKRLVQIHYAQLHDTLPFCYNI